MEVLRPLYMGNVITPTSSYTPQKTNMTMEHPPFEDVFPIEMGIFQCHVSFLGCNLTW